MHRIQQSITYACGIPSLAPHAVPGGSKVRILQWVKLGTTVRVYFGKTSVEGKYQGIRDDTAVIVTDKNAIFYVRLGSITAIKV